MRYLCLILLISNFGCGNKELKEEEAYKLIPVRLKESGQISLMDHEGKIILEDEFSEESRVIYSEGIVFEQGKKSNSIKYHKIDGNKAKQITEERYAAGTPFVNGYALARKENGLLVLLNKEGKEQITNLSKLEKHTVVRAGVVSDGLLRFKTDEGLWGYCNTKGEIKIEPKYKSCENFNEGMARVRNSDGLVEIINKSGEVKFKGKEDFAYYPLSSDLIGFREKSEKGDEFYGFVDLKGEKKIKDNKYTKLGSDGIFRNGLMAVRGEEKDSWGVINEKGEAVGELKTKFENEPVISNSGEVLVNISEDKKCKIYNKSGELKKVISDYSYVMPLKADRYFAVDKNEKKCYIIDRDGKELSKDAFFLAGGEFIQSFFHDRNYKNELSLESTYFEFDPLFKEIFKEVSLDGMCGVKQKNSIEQVITVVPYASSEKNKKKKKYASKSDDYELEMLSVAKKSSEDSKPWEDGDVAEAPTLGGGEIANDKYPFLSAYGNNYSPQTINMTEGSYSLNFTFNEPLKKMEILTDPVDYTTSYISSINNAAQLQSITCRISLNNFDAAETFEKQVINKLKSAGWSQKDSDTKVFTNRSNQNTIIVSGTMVQFKYPEMSIGIEPGFDEGMDAPAIPSMIDTAATKY